MSPPEADPRPPGELEAEAARLGDRGREAAREPGRIEDQEQRLRAPGERGESTEAFGDLGRLVGLRQPAAGQVEHEQVDRATGQQRARDREALVQAGRGDDDEPLEPDAAGDRLDRVEAAREVQPGHDRALRLGLRDDAAARASSGRWSRRRGSRRWPTCGRPPGPRIASSAANPVWMTRSSSRRGRARPWALRPGPMRPPARAPGPVPP